MVSVGALMASVHSASVLFHRNTNAPTGRTREAQHLLKIVNFASGVHWSANAVR
jgi:hypothetical protein